MQNDLTGIQHSFLGLQGALSTPTFYNILNIDATANRMMIREAYLRLKNMYQSGGDGLYGIGNSEDFARQTAEIEEAFAVLNDDLRRQEYDRSLNIGLPIDHGRPNVAPAGFSVPAISDHSHSDLGWKDQSFAETIQTNRSTLKVIKTRAVRSEDALTQDAIKNILAEADLGDGQTLQKLRMAVNVSDLEIQERTKISLDYIRSMEANRFDRLPQVVFVKGFMRSYLKYLCVPNPEAIILAFAARLEAWQQGHKQ